MLEQLFIVLKNKQHITKSILVELNEKDAYFLPIALLKLIYDGYKNKNDNSFYINTISSYPVYINNMLDVF